MRALLTLLAAVSLAACTGGVTGTSVSEVGATGSIPYMIGGTVSGLTGTGLVLQNNGGNNLAVTANGSFTFTTTEVLGNAYSVTVLKQPTAPNETCVPTNSTGTVGLADVTDVSITCAAKTTTTDTIGGTVVGLAGSGLVLQNNGGDDLAIAANGNFTFATPVVSGVPYSVTVLSPPTSPNQSCVVTAGSGMTAMSDVNNVAVACTTSAAASYMIGGSVSGLPAGQTLVIQDNGRDSLTVGNGLFTFATPVASGGVYSVTLLPGSAAQSQSCAFTNASGVVKGAVSNVSIVCNQAAAATLVSIEVTPSVPSAASGVAEQFTATGIFSDNSPRNITSQVTWTSSDTAVAAVSNATGTEGLATTAMPGTSTVTASMGAVTNSTTLTVTAATLVSIQVTPANPTIAKGVMPQFTATGIYTDHSTKDLTSQVAWSSSSPTVASVSSANGSQGLAATLATGATTVSASIGGASGSTTLTVSAAALVSIEVTPATPSVAKGLRPQFVAMGIYTDNSRQTLTTQVTWSSSNPAVASISNAAGSQGQSATLAVGTSMIVASSGTVSGNTSLTVTAATLTSLEVMPATASVAKGVNPQFTATGIFTDSSTQSLTTQVTWSSTVAAVATISNAVGTQGLATSIAVGATTITARYTGISAPSGAVTGTASLTVTPATLVSIGVSPAGPSVAKGLTEQFTATGIYTDNSMQTLTTQVTWESSLTTVATISNAAGSQGLASSAAVGTTTISATFTGASAPSGPVTGTTTLIVTPATLVSISVTPPTPSVAAGLSKQFAATGIYTDNSMQTLTTQVTWTSSDTAFATISNAAGTQGLAAAVAVGVPTITATFTGASAPNGPVSGATTLTVTTATLVSISVTPGSPSVAAGLSQPFAATGTYTNNTTADLTTQVVWSSSDTNAATISNTSPTQGVASSTAVGTPTITATFTGASAPNGPVTGTATLHVTAATLVSISVTPASPSIAAGLSQPFVATGTYTNNTTADLTTQVVWSSSDTNAATISNTSPTQGVASSTAVGTPTITATFTGPSAPNGAVVGSTVLSVTAAVVVSISVTPANLTITNGTTQQYAATGSYSDGTNMDITTQVYWTTDEPTVATISNFAGAPGELGTQGLATLGGAGTTNITAQISVPSAPGGLVSGSTSLTVRYVIE